MDDNNSAPRLLSRPGEGIYNDAAGAVEGNSPFQVVWLPDEERDAVARRKSAHWPSQRHEHHPEPDRLRRQRPRRHPRERSARSRLLQDARRAAPPPPAPGSARRIPSRARPRPPSSARAATTCSSSASATKPRSRCWRSPCSPSPRNIRPATRAVRPLRRARRPAPPTPIISTARRGAFRTRSRLARHREIAADHDRTHRRAEAPQRRASRPTPRPSSSSSTACSASRSCARRTTSASPCGDDAGANPARSLSRCHHRRQQPRHPPHRHASTPSTT